MLNLKSILPLFAALILAFPTITLAEDPAVPVPPVEAPPAVESPVPSPAPITQPVVRQEIRVRQLQPIEFGSFSSEGSGGGITIGPNGGRRVQGNISTVGFGGTGAAEFEILGHPDEMVIIYLPDRVNLSKNSGSADVVITNLTIAPEGTITLDQQGRARVKVGGTLMVPGNMSPGSYNGMFDLDVRYLR